MMENIQLYNVSHIKQDAKVNVIKIDNKYVIDIEDNETMTRLYFDDLKSLYDIIFFQTAYAVQPFMKGGE